MVHVGLSYEKWGNGFKLQQERYCLALKPIPLEKARAQQLEAACTRQEKHFLHAGIWVIAFLMLHSPRYRCRDALLAERGQVTTCV